MKYPFLIILFIIVAGILSVMHYLHSMILLSFYSALYIVVVASVFGFKGGSLAVLLCSTLMLLNYYRSTDMVHFSIVLGILILYCSIGMGIGLIIDIMRSNQKTLLAEKQRLSVTLDSIGDGVISTDEQGKITLMNKVAENLTGWNQDKARGRPLDEVYFTVNEQSRVKCDSPVKDVLEKEGVIDMANHTALISKEGIERSIADSAAPILDMSGNVSGVVLAFKDVTEERRSEREIRYLSFHDKLTGLYNRAYFEEEIKRLDTKRQLPLSIIMGDVNGLKLVNDAFGHDEGDRLLKTVAHIIKRSCRSEDIISRWGGDEFAILLPKAELEDASKVCERIKQACAKAVKSPVQCSIALGVSTKERYNERIEQVLSKAEDRMYKHKLIESKSTRSSIIASLRKMLFEKSNETEEHAARVTELALKLGAKLGLSSSQLDSLVLLAPLHDIGKIVISDEILLKKGCLKEEEWDKIKKHPEIGYRIAQSSPEIAHIADSILAHHEWWDGSGYPHGLKGEDIPLISRILAIVDAYDVMICGRPYKKPLNKKEAILELKESSGSQFDPLLVKLFLDIVN